MRSGTIKQRIFSSRSVAATKATSMYYSESGINPKTHAVSLRAQSRAKVSAIIYFIGLTSLMTDISSEMVASVLPIYLFTVLRLSPFEFGLIDGLYNGSTAIVRLAAAYLSDRTQQHKTIAFIGYLLSALSKCGLLVAGVAGWASVAAVILVDRVGKGIRTAPRDALIAENATADNIGAAFGVHRALDAAGALIGPLLATGMLLWLPKRFDYVFMLSLSFALFGLLILGLCVRAKREHAETSRPDSPAASFITIDAAIKSFRTPGFLLLTGASAVLSFFTLTDNMIYIGLQQRLAFPPAYVPLLFVATAAVFMCMAIPAGKLADRFGHLRVFLLGYLMLAVVYALFAVLPTLGGFDIAVYVILLGVFYAATDGVLVALAVKQLPPHVRATGIACISTVSAIGRMGSSFLFGWLWERQDQAQAVGIFSIGMLLALAFTMTCAVKLSRSLHAGTTPAEFSINQ